MILLALLCATGLLLAKEKKVEGKVCFMEIGSVNCTPCKMMKEVMQEIRDEYQDKITIVFHDINKEKKIAKEYDIKLIPTQIFFDKNGKEYYRHEGYLPKEDVEKIINKEL